MDKFKIGDVVVPIKLDEQLMHEPYDCLGESYKRTLFSKGTIIGVAKGKYVVQFDSFPSTHDQWFFNDSELVSYEEYKINKRTIETLYGN